MKSKQPPTPTTRSLDGAPRRPGLPVTLGRLVATPAALAALTRHDVLTAVGRHTSGDWGDCCPEDAAENNFALDKYLRIFSVYHSSGGVKFWVITEADRSLTTVLLPEDY